MTIQIKADQLGFLSQYQWRQIRQDGQDLSHHLQRRHPGCPAASQEEKASPCCFHNRTFHTIFLNESLELFPEAVNVRDQEQAAVHRRLSQGLILTLQANLDIRAFIRKSWSINQKCSNILSKFSIPACWPGPRCADGSDPCQDHPGVGWHHYRIITGSSWWTSS